MIRPLFLILLFLLSRSAMLQAQQQAPAIQATLLNHTFDPYHYTPAPKRALLRFSRTGILARLNPVNYIAAGLLFVYQRVFSEQIQASCNYAVSCSEYTKLSIQKLGFFTGTLRGIDQLSTCFPGIQHDYPEYKLTPDSKIINSQDDE